MIDSVGARFRKIYLPYCLERLSDGLWLPLNRNYKPLGVATDAWVDYETAPADARLKLTAADVRTLSIHAGEAPTRIYLYNDGCVPRPGTAHWAAYCAKLERLAKR